MEQPIANTNPAPPSASAPMPQAPPPMAQPMPQATPPMGGAPMGGMANNGAFINNGGGGIKGWFKDINLLDVTISAFIIGGIIYAVQYYRLMMTLEKTGYADVSSRMAKLESAIAAQKAEMNASGNASKLRRQPLMRLG